MGTFTMPSLGSDMEAGQLTEWLVAPGDRVSRGDVVAVVETQKGAIEVEIFEDGTVETLIARPGETLAVGAPMAEISVEGAAKTAQPPEPVAPAPAPATAPRAPEPAPAPPRAEGAPPPSSPAARHLAQETGIDLETLSGSGPGGAILRADVEKATAGEAPRAATRGFDLTAMRAAVGAAMSRSKREIPHYYLAHDIDLQRAADWLSDTNAEREPARRILMPALFLKATALAAGRVSGFSGHFTDDEFHPAPEVHAGLAVALRGGGLVAPALRDTAQLSLDDLMDRMRDLVARARAGRLRSSEVTQATLTVSSLGDGGVDAMTGVIFPPQVALIAFGAPRPCARPTADRIEIRETVTVTLAADHRVSDGRRGARYLKDIETLLQSPEEL
ncbi:dihydrolipoamide acetyltransferase family protein [Arenibacterium sp. CAU 1754]